MKWREFEKQHKSDTRDRFSSDNSNVSSNDNFVCTCCCKCESKSKSTKFMFQVLSNHNLLFRNFILNKNQKLNPNLTRSSLKIL